LPASGSTDVVRGRWRKIVFFSSKLRGFAPSREPVITASPASCPLSRALAGQASLPARLSSPQARTARPTGGGHEQQPGPERRKSTALRLPGSATTQ